MCALDVGSRAYRDWSVSQMLSEATKRMSENSAWQRLRPCTSQTHLHKKQLENQNTGVNCARNSDAENEDEAAMFLCGRGKEPRGRSLGRASQRHQ